MEEFEFSPKANLLVGLNGMGKTNALDAIYYLCMTKSRFAGTDRNVIQRLDTQKAEFFRLEGHFEGHGLRQKVVAKVIPGQSKVFEVNDKSLEKLTDHIGQYPVVFIVPDDSSLILEGSESRRMLMDNALAQMHPEYLLQLLTYNRLLKQRNAALKVQLETRKFDPGLLSVYDQQMELPSNQITRFRLQFLVEFNPLLQKFYRFISGNAEQINCTFQSDLTEIAFSDLMQENREKDRITGRTSGGLHRDDLKFLMEGLPLKRFASQGQLKSFVLAIKLAQFELLQQKKGHPPFLLLDDIFDKLDDKRVAALLALLQGPDFGQIFISDTHENRTQEILGTFSGAYKKFDIQDGKIL